MAKRSTLHIRSSYLYDAFNVTIMRRMVSGLVKLIKESEIEYDSIACRGVSGLMIASPVALRLNKPLIVIRKGTSNCHSSIAVEGYLSPDLRYIIIDDFISSGNTIKEIIKEIEDYYIERRKYWEQGGKPDCKGLFLYRPGDLPNYKTEWKKIRRNKIHGPVKVLSEVAVWPERLK